MWRWLPILIALSGLALAGTGCGADKIITAEGTISCSPGTMAWSSWLGFNEDQDAFVINSGRAPLTVRLATTGPFRLRRGGRVVTATAGRTVVPIQFAPQRTGDFSGQLTATVDSTGAECTLDLLGTAKTPPPCQPTQPCEDANFDPDEGVCIREIRGDDEPCDTGNKCQLEERCVSGECVGRPRDCDDSDICTIDSCNQASGTCVYAEKTCPEPDSKDLCKVSACDKMVPGGCYFKDADLGTRCGEYTCEKGMFCQEGACVEWVPPEGFECTRDCGDGHCKNKVCERDDGQNNLLTGKLLYPSTFPIDFQGLTDPDGYLYFLVNQPKFQLLMAVGHEGIWRYKDALAILPGDRKARMMRFRDSIVLALGNQIELRASDTGEPIFRVDLQVGVPQNLVVTGTDRSVVARSGDLIVTAALRPQKGDLTCNDLKTLVVALDETGAQVWKNEYEGRLVVTSGPGLVSDEQDNIWFTRTSCDADDDLIGIAPDGSELGAVSLEGCRGCELLAAAQGVAFLAGDITQVPEETHDSFLVRLPHASSRWDLGFQNGEKPLLGSTMDFVVGGGAEQVLIHGVDPDLHERVWTHEMPVGITSVTDTFLTAPRGNPPRESAVIVDNRVIEKASSAWLTELLADGSTKRACTMGDVTTEGTVVVEDQAIVAVSVVQNEYKLMRYQVPFLQLGSGWVGAFGGPARDGHPR